MLAPAVADSMCSHRGVWYILGVPNRRCRLHKLQSSATRTYRLGGFKNERTDTTRIDYRKTSRVPGRGQYGLARVHYSFGGQVCGEAVR
jgi:hypothetical protein